MNGTPHPAWPISPTAPPNSAASWTYGAYTSWAPPAAPQPSPGLGPWGTYTPGGTWSSASPAASWGPQTPAAYSPWIPPRQQQQQQQGGTWITPNMLNPPSPYDLGAKPPIWPADGAVGYSGYPEGWDNPKPSTPKKSHSKKRHNPTHDEFSKRPPLYRSTSWGTYPTKGSPLHPAATPANFPAYAKGDVFDERNLARRPLDWRPEYKPRLASWLSKNRTEIAGNVLYLLFHTDSHYYL